MAEIISGKSRFISGNNDKDVERRIDEPQAERPVKRSRQKLIKLTLVVFILAIVVSAVIGYMYNNITYTGYDVLMSVNRDDSENTRYLKYRDGYIRYSSDGIAYSNSHGKSVWDKTFSIQKPQIKICGNAVAAANIGGSSLHIFNEEGFAGSVDTSLPISQVEVASQGVVAVVLEDNEANYINLYDSRGNIISSIKTSISGDGYPLDISISRDGTRLIASYVYVSGESIKNNVVFYNFSEVGQNETERIVGGFNHYEDTMVGDVFFMDDTTVAAIGENVISIYRINEYPKLYKEVHLDNAIERVCYSDEYIGIVQANTESQEAYRMTIYNKNGTVVGELAFATQYNDISFNGDTVVMNNALEFVVYSFDGRIVAQIEASLPISHIFDMGKRSKYIYISSKYVQFIRLK